MADFKLPDLGENIETGEVINVLVAEGDTLSEDQPVIELETDKAVIEVPSSVSGRVSKVLVAKGDQARVGQVILTVEAEGEAPPRPSAVAAHEAAAARDLDVALPELGEGVHGGDVVGILVAVGDRVEAESPLIEIEIDKGVVELPSPAAGTIAAIYVQPGDRAAVGQRIATLIAAAGAPVIALPAPQRAAPTSAPASATAVGPAPVDHPATRLVPAAPSVRRLAREIGVDVAVVQGRGPGGRICDDDVKAFARQLNQGRVAPTAGGAATPWPDFGRWGQVEHEPFSNVRRLTAQRLAAAWATIPHVTQFDRADVTALEAWRRQHGPQVEKAGGKLTPTALILKVAAAALRKFPQFCASIDMAGQQVIYKKYCHIGVAVDTKRGLLVPVIRDVDRKTVTQLSVELTAMAEKTRTGRVAVEEMQGGCFTISNLGGIGGTGFTPIVNAPEVAILGVARSRTEAVYVDGQLQPRLIMPLSLSYDHRLIDGADGARFLRFLCQGLESPFFLAFEA